VCVGGKRQDLTPKPKPALCGLGQDGEMLGAIGIVQVDRLAPVSVRGDVVDASGEFLAKRAGHGVKFGK